jgi:PAS domain S-box-containing protein
MDTPQTRRTAHQKADLRRPNYLALLESASDGIFHVSANGVLMEVNAKGRGMLGYARKEMPPLTVEDIIAAEDAALIGPELARARAGEIVQSEWRFRRRDGSRFQGEVHASALPDGEAVCVVRDITRLKDLQDLQLESTEAQRMAEMGSWEWTAATGAIRWSEGLYLILGRDPVLPPPVFAALSQFYTQESWERLMAAQAKMMATGGPPNSN